MICDRTYNDILPQMKNLNIVMAILMYFLTINIENALFFTKRESRERYITMTLTNHKRHCL